MMRKLPWILLALSITFNFAFTGGLLEARSAKQVAAEPEQASGDKAELVAEKLGLSGEQRKAYVDTRRQLWKQGTQLREAMALAREERRAELGKSSPDLARVAEIEAGMADISHQMRLLAAEHMEQFVERLTPEQRRELGGMMRHQTPRRVQVPPALKRFDTNHDGMLDEQERQAARQRLHELRPMRPGGSRDGNGLGEDQGRRPSIFRQEMIRRFDVNGDGVLDEGERAEARKVRRQQTQASTAPSAGTWGRRPGNTSE